MLWGKGILIPGRGKNNYKLGVGLAIYKEQVRRSTQSDEGKNGRSEVGDIGVFKEEGQVRGTTLIK